MNVRIWCLGMSAVLACLGACSNNDEVVMAKDEALREQESRNSQLQARLSDQESLRLVEERQRGELQSEIDRLRREREAGNSPAPLVQTPNNNQTPVERPVSTPAPSAPVASASTIKIDDPDIEVDERANGEVVLRMKGAKSLFNSGEADLSAQGKKLAGKVGDILKKYPDYKVSVEGHTDDTPLKRTADRWKDNTNLSIARALAVKNFLTETKGVAADRMHVVGYGEKRPLASGKTDAARAKNRRVEVVLHR